MDLPVIIGVGIVVIILGYIWFAYNTLVTARQRVNEAFSQIDVQLKRRTDLIPNLVNTVKGYAYHEKDVLEKVTQARASLMSATSTKEKAEANNMLTGALKSLFAVAESYPDLKASTNFLELQQELADTENKIAYSRQFFNSNVLDYNTKISTFPNVIIANLFHFTAKEFFAATEEEKKVVNVDFNVPQETPKSA